MDVENVPIDDFELNGVLDEKDDIEASNGTANGDSKSAGNLMKKPSPPSDGKKRGSKKITRQNSREGLPNHVSGALNGFVAPRRSWKNSRRSRNGYGRGLPKKNGAGGKGRHTILKFKEVEFFGRFFSNGLICHLLSIKK